MAYDVLTTDEFDAWFDGLTANERRRLAPKIDRLEERGPMLDYPESSSIRGSTHGAKMRELRIQIGREPFRILYAFDVLQRGVLLLGGNKVGDEKQWYKQNVPIADRLFGAHQEKAIAEKKALEDAVKRSQKKGGK